MATGTYIYRYDHQGQRVIKDSNGQVRLYFYDQFGQLLAEQDQAGNSLVEYIYVNGQRLAMSIGTQIYYVHSNHLDAPLALTDTSGDIVWQASYTPFGKVNVEINLLPEQVTARFPGQYADAESGFYYNYFRDYDPEIGRYVQSDPIGLAGGINTYGYVGGNPIMYYDPYGLWAWGEPLPQSAVNFAAGFGDGISFGVTDWFREQVGTNGSVNQCSLEYQAGEVGGVLVPVTGVSSWLYKGFRAGKEIKLGKNFRLAPFGNRTGHKYGRWPHYHRRGKPGVDGQTQPGQGIGRHRPFQPSPHDKVWIDRF